MRPNMPRQWFNADQLNTLISMLTRRVNSPRTSSMGRLFDAVAAICGLPPVVSFEGQAAMALEFAADEHEQSAYTLHCQLVVQASRLLRQRSRDGRTTIIVADWEPMIRSVLADRAAGVPIGRISARFHNALADMAVAIARSCRERWAPTCRAVCPSCSPAAASKTRCLRPGFAPGCRRPVSPYILIIKSRRATAALPSGKSSSPCNNCKDRPMCLGIPGRLVETHQQDDLPMGKVEFGGILKEVCLAYTPEAQVGDYVLVHVGFAISRIDEAEAQEIFGYLEEIGAHWTRMRLERQRHRRMTNVELQMPKEARSTNVEGRSRVSSFASDFNFVIPSSFEFRHSSFPS